ncbi:MULTISPECIES: phage antirepressor N-terminal domain-containing protein [unclassified Novosphingobium]|uniref:phage antirepressor N-terminal domain-containing protein n=1 Tax=unclassified Novosphingobium TaxID=2644732 RepID=UPI000D30605B|nr:MULTISPECIES: phage antirepressor N-terminal domain-containing protein [unclassified Novosphingobium]PTR06450.1 P22-like antirepressor protein [Novosphingobium sp. GV055]PUA94869.1 P22-like antirepressor protein [Novosphingobium sp. GV061]PUB13794.1 P22-like antirepressor protein [Novosphingobium sp. GV079]PUB38492.1 P22-like antirepressor protein [Novosphingobium sp. GV027]
MPPTSDTPKSSVVAIDFHGDQIVTFQHQGEPYVAMRRVVENLGLAWQVQQRKLAECGSRFACHHMVTHDTTGRRQEMLSMPVAKLPLWLATINPNKIPDPVKRAKIELYQAESAIVLHDYWTKGVAVRGDMEGVVTSLDRSVMNAIGGMVKSIMTKQLAELVPALVEREVLAGRYGIVQGVCALQVAEMAGYTKGRRPRGATQFISRRLGRYHEDRAVPIRRSEHGSGRVRLFDETTARRWLADGGKTEIDHYIAGRSGQGSLRLIR